MIILIVCVLICFSTFTDEEEYISALKRLIILCMILISVVFIACYATKPTAMDVYQDKTTMEITYKDGVPVDSVVWKGDKK